MGIADFILCEQPGFSDNHNFTRKFTKPSCLYYFGLPDFFLNTPLLFTLLRSLIAYLRLYLQVAQNSSRIRCFPFLSAFLYRALISSKYSFFASLLLIFTVFSVTYIMTQRPFPHTPFGYIIFDSMRR